MKVLFIGEGKHDIGVSSSPFHPRPADGPVAILARRVSPSIGTNSIALQWIEIPRYLVDDKKASATKRGIVHKLKGAALLAEVRFACNGVVAVADRDGDGDREEALKDAAAETQKDRPNQAIVWGLAHQSIEAWTLAVPEAIAEELGVELDLVRKKYPRGKDVEELLDSSGKEEHRPKQLLSEIFELSHRKDHLELRQAVAERTDVIELEKRCKMGFAPFAKQLRDKFGRI